MKLKAAVKYQLWEARSSVMTFYGIILALIIFFSILTRLSNGSMSGMDGLTPIFLFIAGIVTFSTEFKLYMQSGLSRKLLSQSILASLIVGCFIMLAADALINIFCMVVSPGYVSTTKQMYPDFGIITRSFYHYGLLLFMSYAGFFIGALYYRMNKLLTILVSVGVPILLIFLGAGVNVADTVEKTPKSVNAYFMDDIVAFIGQSPLHLGVCLLIFAAIFALLSHLLTRKAYIK